MSDFVYSPIKLDQEFEVLPETPVPAAQVRAEEFSEASTLQRVYCQQLSVHEYEEQGRNNTELALEGLIDYMNKHPMEFEKVLRKRKKEEVESAGLTSFLKCRLMSKLQGEKFSENLVSNEECLERLGEVQRGMRMAHTYYQETKPTRYNTRSADKQTKELAINNSPVNTKDCRVTRSAARMSTASLYTHRSPPTQSPTKRTLTDVTNTMARSPARPQPKIIKALKRTGSTASRKSVHEELTATDQRKRLRPTPKPRSTETPVRSLRGRRPSIDSMRLQTPGPLDTSESLSTALMRIMDQKFRHVRSSSSLDDTGSSLDWSNGEAQAMGNDSP